MKTILIVWIAGNIAYFLFRCLVRTLDKREAMDDIGTEQLSNGED